MFKILILTTGTGNESLVQTVWSNINQNSTSEEPNETREKRGGASIYACTCVCVSDLTRVVARKFCPV